MKKQIERLIKGYKDDIKEYHLERVKKEMPKTEIKGVDSLIEEVDNWEFSPDMDLAYLMGKIAILEFLLTAIKERIEK